MDEVTKRDLFAMAALQGLLAGPTMVKSAQLAQYAYQIADQMMDESVTPRRPIDPSFETPKDTHDRIYTEERSGQ